MGGLECVITGLMDEFRDFFRRFRISREIFTAVVVFVSFLVALSCITPVMDHLHWRSLLAKSLAISRHGLTCLGHLGRYDTDRIISIYDAPPKVAKESKESVITQAILLAFSC
jgi:hypothetical protein